MKLEQRCWTKAQGWLPAATGPVGTSAQLVLVFGATAALRETGLFESVRDLHPMAQILGCSTGGEITGTRVLDHSLVMTAIHFEHSKVHGRTVNLTEAKSSFDAGALLATGLPHSVPHESGSANLVHVLVLSDGLGVNGSDLVQGMTKHLPEGVTLTGGLAGDGTRFAETLVMYNSPPEMGRIAAVGLYGSRLRVGIGSLGGWDSFGPERLITRSKGNVLYELDGQSALGLYRKYLGEHADGLPATGLLFPLSLRTKADENAVVRTILAINPKEQSLTFAGDIPEGAYARLMKANFDRLIDGAVGAAKASHRAISRGASLGILISCIGRKLVLKQRIEEEVEGVRDVLGEGTALTGFYSYGEISPFTLGGRCELHNQTMTITTLSEE